MTEQKTNINIALSCPCCGGGAKVQFDYYNKYVRIFCAECGLSTLSVPVIKMDDPAPALELWNRRVNRN